MIFLPFAVFLAVVLGCVITGQNLLWALCFGIVLFAAIALRRGHSFSDVCTMAWKKGRTALVVISVLMIIGTMTNRVSLSVRPDFSVPLYCGEYQTFIKIISRIDMEIEEILPIISIPVLVPSDGKNDLNRPSRISSSTQAKKIQNTMARRGTFSVIVWLRCFFSFISTTFQFSRNYPLLDTQYVFILTNTRVKSRENFSLSRYTTKQSFFKQ